MLHSIPVVATPAPCFTRERAASGSFAAGPAGSGSFAVGYAAFGSGDGRPLAHRLLPLALSVLILDFDSGAALLTGQRDRATLDGPTEWARGVSVGLTPLGAAALTGLPLSEVSGQTVALDLPWVERLAALPSWTARFAWLDAVRLGSPPEVRWAPSPVVAAAWSRLQRPARVSDVAAGLGVTRRRLERDFRREIGLSPGAVSRTARLQRSLTGLLRGDPPATAAARGGFADQAHLTRTMRAAVGLTPAVFRAFVQDLLPAAAPASGA